MKIENNIVKDNKRIESNNLKLKVYNKPEITKFGAMQRVTLGGSVGFGDSGGAPEFPPGP